jgi:hypothetical protein
MWEPPSKATARAVNKPTTTARLRILSRYWKKVERLVGPSPPLDGVARSRVQGRARFQVTPPEDEVQVLPALGSTCGRRGPYPTVLGRPAPDT